MLTLKLKKYLLVTLLLLSTSLLYSQDFVEVIKPERTFNLDYSTSSYIGFVEFEYNLVDTDDVEKVCLFVNNSNLSTIFNESEIITGFGETGNERITIGVKVDLKKKGFNIKAPDKSRILKVGYDELSLHRYIVLRDYFGNEITYGNVDDIAVHPGQRVAKEEKIACLNQENCEIFIIIKRNGIYWDPINTNELTDKIGIYYTKRPSGNIHHNTVEKLYLYNEYYIGESEKCDFYLGLLKDAEIIYPLTTTIDAPLTEFYSSISNTSDKNLGLDINGKNGDEIIAVNDGLIIERGYEPLGFGNYITLRDCNGINYIYGHMLDVEVDEGDYIKKGEIIGQIGKTGFILQDGLHFGIMIDDVFIDPMIIFKDF